MNWKDYCRGFAIQKQTVDWEGKCLAIVGALEKISVRLINEPLQVPDGWVPSGTVKWVSKVLGRVVVPDYYPDFLKDWVKRKVWKSDNWPLGQRIFIKPADIHKRFTGFVTFGGYRKKKRGPYWCSEVVHFQNEWRYYIAYGKMIGGYWYWGEKNEPQSTPELDIVYPENWCGTADFGQLENGEIQLVEAHPPFACGWYGKNHIEYAEFLALGCKWLKENGDVFYAQKSQKESIL